MQAPLVRKTGRECAPIQQRYTEQREAHWAKTQGRRKYIFTDQIVQARSKAALWCAPGPVRALVS
jgi:hypothetical protein